MGLFRRSNAAEGTTLRQKIAQWRVRHAGIIVPNPAQIEDSKNDAARLFFQQAIGSQNPIGLYIPKSILTEALNDTNRNQWDFLVCFIGLEPDTQLLRPTYHFYPNVGGFPGGTEASFSIGGGGGGGGGVANSTPPPTL